MATGGMGAIDPSTFAKMVLEISLKSISKWVWGGGSGKFSEEVEGVAKEFSFMPRIFVALVTPLDARCNLQP